jgi:hypothetical protein
MVGQGGIILIRILKLRANSHDLMQLLKCNINFDLRKIDSWFRRFGEISCEVQRTVGNLGVCFEKLRILPKPFCKAEWNGLTSRGRDSASWWRTIM